MDAQGGADGDVCAAVHLVVEHQGDEARVRDHPGAHDGAVLQLEDAFAAVHHQSVGDLIFVGAREEAVGAVEGDGHLVALVGVGDVVAVRILGQLHVAEVHQGEEVAALICLQVGQEVCGGPGGAEGEAPGLGCGGLSCIDVDRRALGDIQKSAVCSVGQGADGNAPAGDGAVGQRQDRALHRAVHIAPDHIEGGVVHRGHDAHGVIPEEHQVARDGGILSGVGVFSQVPPKGRHGGGAGVAGVFRRIRAGVMEAEGDEHGRPIPVGGAVPGAVPGVAPADAVPSHFVIFLTFPVAYLGLGDAYQVLAQVSGVGVVGEQALPIQGRFRVGGFVCIAAQVVDVGFQAAAGTAAGVGVLLDAAGGIARQSQARLAQHPENIQGNGKGERKQNSGCPDPSDPGPL